jgi:hypothetical protein
MITTIFNNIKSTRPVQFTNAENVLTSIKTGLFKEAKSKAKSAKKNSIEEYIKIKHSLPAVTWAGKFNSRSNEGVESLSGLMYFDSDTTDDLSKLKNYDFVLAGWRSLSDDGIGFLVKVEGLTVDNFEPTYNHIKKEVSDYKLDNLPDIARLNIISSDKDIYYNKKARVLFSKEREIEERDIFIENLTFDLEKACQRFAILAEKKYGAFLYDNGTCALTSYFCQCLQRGINKDDARAFLIERIVYEWHKDIDATANYVYCKYRSQFNTKR